MADLDWLLLQCGHTASKFINILVSPWTALRIKTLVGWKVQLHIKPWGIRYIRDRWSSVFSIKETIKIVESVNQI